MTARLTQPLRGEIPLPRTVPLFIHASALRGSPLGFPGPAIVGALLELTPPDQSN